ncbi:DUF6959 family protein [Actinoplanes sp. CA-252034]|uniref:DUF6959 family protein n=1 Tax=Actinoplanes sp. CA-252034 TaxID=3239906 RepID=UPI003D955DC5
MMENEARVLAVGGNVAVTHLDGRAFPGVHVQGDTFAGLRAALAGAAGRLRQAPGDAEALDDLDYAIGEMTLLLEFYEHTLAERGVERPYVDTGTSGEAGSMSDAEIRQFVTLLKRFADLELDQFAHWRVETPYGPVFVDLSRRCLPGTEEAYDAL